MVLPVTDNKKYKKAGVKREAFAQVIRDIIAKRPSNQWCAAGQDVYRGLQHEIAASKLMNHETASRRLYAILNGTYKDRNGKVSVQEIVDLDTADKILQALDLTDLWHTDLAGQVVTPVCAGCGGDCEEITPGCHNCNDRRLTRAARKRSADRQRELRAKKTAATSGALAGVRPVSPAAC